MEVCSILYRALRLAGASVWLQRKWFVEQKGAYQ